MPAAGQVAVKTAKAAVGVSKEEGEAEGRKGAQGQAEALIMKAEGIQTEDIIRKMTAKAVTMEMNPCTGVEVTLAMKEDEIWR